MENPIESGEKTKKTFKDETGKKWVKKGKKPIKSGWTF